MMDHIRWPPNRRFRSAIIELPSIKFLRVAATERRPLVQCTASFRFWGSAASLATVGKVAPPSGVQPCAAPTAWQMVRSSD